MLILTISSLFVTIYFFMKYRDTDGIRKRQLQVIQLLLSRLSGVSTVEYFEDTLTALEVLLDIDIEKSEEEK